MNLVALVVLILGVGLCVSSAAFIVSNLEERAHIRSEIDDTRTQLQGALDEIERLEDEMHASAQDLSAVESSFASERAAYDEWLDIAVSIDDALEAEGHPRCNADLGGTKACLEAASETVLAQPRVDLVSSSHLDPGYTITLRNSGSRPLYSENFRVTLDHQPVSSPGCTNRDTIEPGQSCVISFSERCRALEVLEVEYDGVSVYVWDC